MSPWLTFSNNMDKNKLRRALLLSIITIGYNIAEGFVSVSFGVADDTLALLGFGVDSFVEVISGIGILHLVIRLQRATDESPDNFERQALRITGFAFYLLAAGLVIGSAINAYLGTKPETTIVGVIISLVSILTMWFLMRAKLKVGKQLGSDAIIADANCTRVCFYLSFLLLASSLLFELSGIRWIDIFGSLGIAWFAFSEGREAFEKARNVSHSCSCGCH